MIDNDEVVDDVLLVDDYMVKEKSCYLIETNKGAMMAGNKVNG